MVSSTEMDIDTIPRSISRTPTVVDVIHEQDKKLQEQEEVFDKDFGFLPIPERLRYHPNRPFYFGLLLNIFFGIASTFSE